VQEELLAKHGDADVRVYANWFSLYPTDLRERWPADVLTDRRVVHFWDEEKHVGRWYGEREQSIESRVAPDSSGLGQSILWDAYLVYGPESRWDEAPTELRRWGRTILRTKESLREAAESLLQGANASK
jgi:hypothetical protein